jgi:HAD superfamily hydrolase (TIGR01509 family)
VKDGPARRMRAKLRTGRDRNAPAAVLFDVDGTLVDTNYLHTVAWAEAFRQAGQAVPMVAIHRAIGMGAGQLIDHLLGADRDRSGDEQLKAAHTALYGTWMPRLRAFDGSADLLRACAARGSRVVLASSASAQEMTALRAALDADDAVTAATCADDADKAKPAPDIVQAALERAGVEAAQAVLVGDSRWDVEASGRAGIDCIGLLTGGNSATELRDAGAVEVYSDPADLLAHLDQSRLTKGPQAKTGH